MARVITLADFQPSERADGQAWTNARIEEVDDPSHGWEEAKTVDLDPVDEDPTAPALRSFTVGVSKEWARLVFLDAEGNEDNPLAMVFADGPQFRPTVAQIAAVLRARTYTGTGEANDPMSLLVGGELAGEFNADTRPTAESVEELIPDACTDTNRAVGGVPGIFLEDKRRVAAMRAAAEIERSYIPEQAEGNIYQTLRITFDEQAAALRQRVQWWALARALEG